VSAQEGHVVQVLVADPALGAGLDPARREAAGQAALAPALYVESGPWDAPADADPAHFGMLVVDGVLTREVTAAGQTSVELLARGDVLRPWIGPGPSSSVTESVSWTVLEPAELAVLDGEFAARVSSWPEIASALMDRLIMRARWLAFQLVVSHVRRTDERLLLLFRHLADRRGRVTPSGVIVPLVLRHQALADLVGAQRPSVTTALGQLRDRGLLERRDDGSWLLREGARVDG
jgi:CRP-like cAMP-binding protein